MENTQSPSKDLKTIIIYVVATALILCIGILIGSYTKQEALKQGTNIGAEATANLLIYEVKEKYKQEGRIEQGNKLVNLIIEQSKDCQEVQIGDISVQRSNCLPNKDE